MTDWRIFQGNRTPNPEAIANLPPPPLWRSFGQAGSVSSTQKERRGATFFAREKEIDMVNAALYLRRPLLVTGNPGSGKTSLAYAVAYELALGEVLTWPITTRSTLKEGLYSYDAVGRLQDAQLHGSGSLERIGKYLRLGPLGTALIPATKPRVLLIDEIDKSDIDLPNDLLHVFEDGEFRIQELERIADEIEVVAVPTAFTDATEPTYQATYDVPRGVVRCTTFPLVILTNNGEREFPPAFLRRCLRLEMADPELDRLTQIVERQLDVELAAKAKALIEEFDRKRRSGEGDLATDQLLNAVYLVTGQAAPETLKDELLRYLNRS